MASVSIRAAVFLAVGSMVGASCGGILGPSCREESAQIFSVNEVVAAADTNSYSITSPRSSNLYIRLTWAETEATLAISATITDCGGHTGCLMDTIRPPFGPGGSSPVPQPWPSGLREMEVDGWKGKTYRIDVTGDTARDASFGLNVTYRITCES